MARRRRDEEKRRSQLSTRLGFNRRSFGAMILAGCLIPALGHAAEASRQMVLTFDDLPYVAQPFPETLSHATRVATLITAALRNFDAPAHAFVNEARLERPGEVEGGNVLLRSWINAGAMLGNHTYAHRDLNRLTAAEFEDEIVRGESTIERLMMPREPYQHYFRAPYNHTGPTAEKKAEIETFLSNRGYRYAPHTIDNEDYIFALPYLDAMRKGDGGTAARLRSAYIDYSLAATEFSEGKARQIFGRDIPQILLLHANDINADSLAILLERLRARGYRFVTLDEAMTDAAYQTPDTVVTEYGPTWLWRWSKSLGLDVDFTDEPEPPEWVSELYAPLSRLPNDPGNRTR